VAAVVEALDPDVKPYVQTFLAFVPTVQKVLLDVQSLLES
jgi:hypothetical protein